MFRVPSHMPTLAERLIEAEQALHMLLLGQSIAEVRDANGESVRYTTGNVGRLRVYISELQALIAAENGVIARRGPMRPIFG